MGLAALLWLVVLAESPHGAPAASGGIGWLKGVALAFAVLAAAQLFLTFLHYLIRGSVTTGRAVRTDLLRTLLSAIIYLGTIFLYLHFELNVNITGLLATSVALSLVVGLALQTSLGNLFAGISIGLEHVARVDDYVRRGPVASEVISLSWRSVHVRSDTGSIYVLPNSSVTSDVLEVIPSAHRVRHEVEFAATAQLAPGLVIQAATRVLRSGVDGVCESSRDEVIMRESQTEANAYRYAARIYIARIQQRDSIGSAVLERVWYEISRIERSSLVVGASVSAGERVAARWPVFDVALKNTTPQFRRLLLHTSRLRRYARHEHIREPGVIFIIDGSLTRRRRDAECAWAVAGVRALVCRAREIMGKRPRMLLMQAAPF